MISTTEFRMVHYIRFSTTAHLALNINLPDNGYQLIDSLLCLILVLSKFWMIKTREGLVLGKCYRESNQRNKNASNYDESYKNKYQ